MARKRNKHDDEHENHERWLVSYADFITLLFAFFVVMYAISQVNEGKYRVLSDSLLQAFKPDAAAETILLPKNDPHSGLPSGMIPRLPINRAEEAKRRAREERMRTIAQQVLQALAPLVQSGQVRVTESARGIAVEINASMLFKSAQATLEPDSKRALDRGRAGAGRQRQPDRGRRAHRSRSDQHAAVPVQLGVVRRACEQRGASVRRQRRDAAAAGRCRAMRIRVRWTATTRRRAHAQPARHRSDPARKGRDSRFAHALRIAIRASRRRSPATRRTARGELALRCGQRRR